MLSHSESKCKHLDPESDNVRHRIVSHPDNMREHLDKTAVVLITELHP